MLRNARAAAFTVSKFLRENQQGANNRENLLLPLQMWLSEIKRLFTFLFAFSEFSLTFEHLYYLNEPQLKYF